MASNPWFGVITLFPEMFDAITQYGITRRAVENQQISVNCWNPRDFTHDKHRTVDDRPYGGGPGMLMMVQPLTDAIDAAKAAAPGDCKVVYLSPQGKKLDQAGVRQLAEINNLILVAGRYEGIDERVIKSHVDEEWSIGDFVLSGGELAAMVVIDSVARLVPGVLGHQDSAVQDSFAEGLLDCPHYTRPEILDGEKVPQVLLSGNHKLINEWRLRQSLLRTLTRRPDLLNDLALTEEQQQVLEEIQAELQQDDS